MSIQIQILSVTASQQPAKTPGKTYSQLELAYKNLTFQGKVEGKKLMGFGGSKAAYDTLINAGSGQVYNIETVKNAAGYIDWVSATMGDGSSSPTPSQPASSSAVPASRSTPAPKSTYETPEERAKKQVYIVRQSSISTAVELLSIGAKTSPDVDKVLEVASRFEGFVFDGIKEDSPFTPGNLDAGGDTLDDIPM